MQTGAGYDDRDGMIQIYRELDNESKCSYVTGSYGPEQLLGLFARADIVVAERFHAAVFSIINRTPMTGISYMPKVSRLFAELGHPEWCVDLDHVSGEALIQSFDSVWSSRDNIQADFGKFRDSMKDRAMDNFRLISACLEKKGYPGPERNLFEMEK
jgi:polysaccharide pyruvyl transferase WcaK-like protein